MICVSVSPRPFNGFQKVSKSGVRNFKNRVLVACVSSDIGLKQQHRILPPIASLTRKNHSGRGLGSFLTFHPYIYNRIPAAFQARHAFPLHLSLCLSLPKACLSTPRTKYSQTPRLCVHYTGCRFPPLSFHLPPPLLSSSGAPRRGGRGGRGRR